MVLTSSLLSNLKNMKSIMNKLSFYTLALATTLVACSQDYNALVAPPQGFEAESAKQIEFNALGVGQTIKIADITTATVKVADFVAPTNIANGAKVTYKLAMKGDKGTEVATLDEFGQLPVDTLKEKIENLYGKNPKVRDVRSVVYAYIQNGKQAFYGVSDSLSVMVGLKAPFIASKYYLVGNMSGWSLDDKLSFSHSSADVYDDPVFSIVFTTTDADQYWKIIPQDNVDAGDIWITGEKGVVGVAVDGDASLEGSLTTANANAGKIVDAGMYRLSINMMDYTYKFEKLNYTATVGLTGNHQGWNPSTAPQLACTNYDGVYMGFSKLDGGFKFTKGAAWADGEYAFSAFTTVPAGFTDGGGGNIDAPAGFYFLKADMNTGVLEATAITAVGVIGDATPGVWSTDTPLTLKSGTDNVWEGTVTLAATGGFKFRMNNDWDVNLGGSLTGLTQNGDNIATLGAGTYRVTLTLGANGQSTAVLTLDN